MRAGVDDMAGSDTVRLMDDQTFEMLDRFGLEPMELGVSAASMAFAEDDRAYYVVGTAFTEPDEAESKKVGPSHRCWHPPVEPRGTHHQQSARLCTSVSVMASALTRAEGCIRGHSSASCA